LLAKILADENVPKSVVAWLRSVGMMLVVPQRLDWRRLLTGASWYGRTKSIELS